MGSYSWTDYCDIHVRKGREKAFKKYLAEQKKGSDWDKDHAAAITVEKDGSVEIVIDNWKIISYWYPETLKWFDKLSSYLEGDLHISFEVPDEYAIVHFSKDGTTYELGQMKYQTYTSKEIR